MLKYCIWNLGGAAFLALFGAIYEYFGHGVYSGFMLYAFAIPLVCGALPFVVAELKGFDPGRAAANLWNSAIAAFSVGSVFKGVLVIYGTENELVRVYPVAGAILAVSALCAAFITRGREKNARKAENAIMH